MKKITILCILVSLFLCSICSAETSKIICEENSSNSVTYTVCETTASPFGRLGKAFSKHIDKEGFSHYWIRLALGGNNYLYYQIKLVIDGKEYILQEEPSPAKYQVASTSRMIMFSDRDGAKNYYVVPLDAIEKLKNADSVIMYYRTQSSDEKEKEWNKQMIAKTKEIINLDYQSNVNYPHG